MTEVMKKYNPILGRIKARINKQNKNCLIVIAGETGSGKSYAAMRIAQMINSNFNIDNVVFSPKEFMKKLETIEAGSCIIFDEAGVGMPSRDWYTVQNKMLGYVMQTFRHLNLCVIFTVPNMSFIDVQLRNLFHMYLETQNINYKKKLCRLRMFYFRQWPRSNKLLSIHPRSKERYGYGRAGVTTRLKMWSIELPQGNLISKYEDKKGKFSKELRDSAYQSIANIEKKMQPQKTKTEGIEEDLRIGKLKQIELAKKWQTTPQRVSAIKNSML